MDEVAFGRYRLLELIGEGGMGQVFKAHDAVIGRDVAIKVLPPEMATLPGYQERFRREAQVAARLTEPHIIPIHDTGEIDGRLYLVMPIIEGIDVQTLLAREGPMTPPRAVHVIRQLAAALNVAHRNGLVHRDIKPSNALMTADEHVYLIDFGIAHDASATRMTQTGMMVGTFSYMAPERFLAGTVDARADVYALTCVLHECLTGARPFPGDSMEQQIAGHLTMEPPKPSAVNPAIPPGFDEVIARGMAKQPHDRYQTAAELAAAAQHALTAAPAPPPPPTLVDERRPPPPTLVDERRPPPPPVHTPPRPPGPLHPMPPGPPRPVGPSPHQATQVAPTQVASLVGPPHGQDLPAPVISGGSFACVLSGVVLVSLAAAALLAPWAPRWRLVHYMEVGVSLAWVIMLGTVSGIALMVLGRGRTFADRTITGCALVAFGLRTATRCLFGTFLPVGFLAIVGIVGLLLMLIPLYSRPNRALAGGCLLCGAGILTLALVEIGLKFFWLHAPTAFLIGGVLIGVIVVVVAGVAWRRIPAPPAPNQPDAAQDVTAGGFTAVLSGVALISLSITLLIVPWGYWAERGGNYHAAQAVCWTIVLVAIAGIVLLTFGRGLRRADLTIAGCALAAVGLSTIVFRFLSDFRQWESPAATLPGVVGLLLLLIPMYARPTRAVARGCLLLCSYVLALIVVAVVLRATHSAYVSWSDLLPGIAIALIALVSGGIALGSVRRRRQGALPSHAQTAR
jgi:serine/threonine protein kinase